MSPWTFAYIQWLVTVRAITRHEAALLMVSLDWRN